MNEKKKKWFTAPKEDISRREAHIKHYRMSENEFQAVTYPYPVHYLDQNGHWQDIDNTLEEAVGEHGRPVLRTRAGSIRAEFPVTADGSGMASVSHNGRTFAWSFEEAVRPVHAVRRSGTDLRQERLVRRACTMPRFVGRTIESLRAADLSEIDSEQDRRIELTSLHAENTYSDILPGVSVRYTLCGSSVKEDILLADAQALSHAVLRLPDSFDYFLRPNRSLDILDKVSGEVLFRMGVPAVYDAEGNQVIADIQLTPCSGYTRLRYTLDPEFLVGAVYPVTIDPVITTPTTNTVVYDTYLYEKYPDTNYGDVHLMRSGTNEGYRAVSLIRFDQLTRLKASDTIISAHLRLYPMNYGSDSEYMGCYPVKTWWDKDEATWNSMTPDNTDHISDDLIAYVTGTTGYRYFDVTPLYRDWYRRDPNNSDNETNSLNTGVAIRYPEGPDGQASMLNGLLPVTTAPSAPA